MWSLSRIRSILLCALASVLLLGFCTSPVQAQETTLTQLSQSINEKLYGLKDELQTLQTDLASTTAQLQQASSDLHLSETERSVLVVQLKTSSDSLQSMTQKYSDLSTNLQSYKVRLDQSHKVVLVLLMVLTLRAISMVVGYILYAKGVKLPRWLDILL